MNSPCLSPPLSFSLIDPLPAPSSLSFSASLFPSHCRLAPGIHPKSHNRAFGNGRIVCRNGRAGDNGVSAGVVRAAPPEKVEIPIVYGAPLNEQQSRMVPREEASRRSGIDLKEIGDDDFIEVGIISGTHGVHGELKVTPLTDFPEERFEQPGIRWVGFHRRSRLIGVSQVELTSGRSMQGKKPCWLISFGGVETLEKAAALVGGTILVKPQDRPTLEEDDLYIPDLIGMSVQLKSSGELIGSIVDVFNSGASDLLRVKLFRDAKKDGNKSPKEGKNHLVWIPFAKEIVPNIDTKKRTVEVVPPEGLLELNAPSEVPSKKELRKQALRTKRKNQEKTAGIKKRVLALKQGHILSGLDSGDKIQRESLRMQLMGIDFKLFEHAVQDSMGPPKRVSNHENLLFPPVTHSHIDWKGLKEWLSNSPQVLKANNNISGKTWDLWQKGLDVFAEGRAAVVTLSPGDQTENYTDLSFLKLKFQCQAKRLLCIQDLAKLISGEKTQIPWVVASTEVSEDAIKNLFKNESYFGLDKTQVLFMKLSCLPYISSDLKDGCHKILMESQWRIMMGSGGEGQVFIDLNDSGVLNYLIEAGVDYIHVCAADCFEASEADLVLFGVMEEQGSSIVVKAATGPLRDGCEILCLCQSFFGIDGSSCNTRILSEPNFDKVDKDSGGTSGSSAESYVVMSPEDIEMPFLKILEDGKTLYKTSPLTDYTCSVEYLKHLSQQRYRFQFKAVPRIVSQINESDGQWVEVVSHETNAVQLHCSIHSALMFCLPSRVALVKSDAAEI